MLMRNLRGSVLLLTTILTATLFICLLLLLLFFPTVLSILFSECLGSRRAATGCGYNVAAARIIEDRSIAARYDEIRHPLFA